MDTGLIKKIAVTFEVAGSQLSEAAMEMIASDLSGYPAHAVSLALDKCRAEVNGRLTIAHVIQRIDDGRPGVEEAWNMLPKTEAETAVLTSEIMEAFGACVSLMDEGDMIGARMAFKEKYSAVLSDARAKGAPVKWSASLGHSVAGRECALREAVSRGRLPAKYACALLPDINFYRDEPALESGGAGDMLNGLIAGVGSLDD